MLSEDIITAAVSDPVSLTDQVLMSVRFYQAYTGENMEMVAQQFGLLFLFHSLHLKNNLYLIPF